MAKETNTIDRRIYNGKKSLNALNVANEVIANLKSGKKINLQKISVSKGYSINSAKAQKAVQTKTYQEALTPVIELMKRVHNKAIMSLDKRNLDKERIDSVVNVAKQMVHDGQLLSGKSTENIASNIVVYGSEDFLALQTKDKNGNDKV